MANHRHLPEPSARNRRKDSLVVDPPPICTGRSRGRLASYVIARPASCRASGQVSQLDARLAGCCRHDYRACSLRAATLVGRRCMRLVRESPSGGCRSPRYFRDRLRRRAPCIPRRGPGPLLPATNYRPGGRTHRTSYTPRNMYGRTGRHRPALPACYARYSPDRSYSRNSWWVGALLTAQPARFLWASAQRKCRWIAETLPLAFRTARPEPQGRSVCYASCTSLVREASLPRSSCRTTMIASIGWPQPFLGVRAIIGHEDQRN